MPTISAVIKYATNLDELRKELKAGTDQLVVLEKAAERTQRNLGGEGLMRAAHNAAAAVQQLGGTTALTGREQEKLNSLMTRTIEKMEALNKAAAEAGKPLMAIPTAFRQIAEATKQAEDATTKASGSFLKLFSAFSLGELAAHGLEKLGEIAIHVAKTIPDLVEKTIKLGSELFTASLKTGISVEGLSKLRYVASQTGTDLNTLTGSIFKMEANLGAMGEGGKKAHDAIERLGLSFKELKNSKPDEAFITILEKIHDLPAAADRAATGMAIFGKGFKEIAQLASEDIGELIKEAERLGIVMSTNTAAAAKAAEDSIAALSAQFEAASVRIGAAFLPAVIGVAHDLSTLFTEAVNDANKGLDQLGGSNGFLATVAKAMGDGNVAIAAQTELYFELRDATVGLIRYALEPLVSSMGFVLTEFNAAKVVFGDVLQIVDLMTLGFKGAALAVAELLSVGNNFGRFKEDVSRIRGEMDAITARIAERGKAIQAAKKAEEDWAKWAQQINQEIEAGLKKVSAGHMDVAALIKHVGDISRAAAAQVGEGFEAEGNKGDTALKAFVKRAQELEKELLAAEKAGIPLSDILKEYSSQIDEITHKAPIFGQAIGEATERAAQALAKNNVQKLLVEQAQDAEKRFEKFREDSLKKAKASQDAANKSYLSNLTAQEKAEHDHFALLNEEEGDSLKTRLAAVHASFEQRRRDLDKHASNYQDALASIDALEVTAARKATNEWEQHVRDVKRQMVTFGSIFREALSGIPELIKKALTGGGGLVGGLQAIFSDLGSKISEHLFAGSLSRALNSALAKLGNTVGPAIGRLLGPIGAAFGAFVGPIFEKALDKIFGTAGRDAIKTFSQGLTGSSDLNALQAKLQSIFDPQTATKYWELLTQGTGRNNARQAAANIKLVEDAIAAATKKQEAFNTELGRFLSEVDKIGVGLPGSIAGYLSELEHAGKLTQTNLDLLHQLLDRGKADWKAIEAAVQRYGGDISKLGGSFQEARLHDSWQQVIDDMQLFEQGGISAGDSLNVVKGKIQELVQQSIRFGTDIPANMRPWIQNLIDAGLLLDETGEKITDIGKLHFGETLQTTLDKLIDKIKELIDAFNHVPSNVDTNVTVHTRTVNEGQDTGDNAVPRSEPAPASTGGYVSAEGQIVHTFSTGGPVPMPQAFTVGGSVPFKPRGTDTVPAMLTPKEGIVNVDPGMRRLTPEGLNDLNTGRSLPLKVVQNLIEPSGGQAATAHLSEGGIVRFLPQGDTAPSMPTMLTSGGVVADQPQWTQMLGREALEQVNRGMLPSGYPTAALEHATARAPLQAVVNLELEKRVFARAVADVLPGEVHRLGVRVVSS